MWATEPVRTLGHSGNERRIPVPVLVRRRPVIQRVTSPYTD